MSLTIDNLHIAIAGKTICNQLSLSFTAGHTWGLLGPNGSGKTTFLHSLMGLHKPTQGQILLEQQPIKNLSRAAIARKMGLLLQKTAYHFPMTVADTVNAGRYAHQSNWKTPDPEEQRIVQQTLTLMGLQSQQHKLNHQLSGGEQRRLAIATLLAQQPDYYLLDEPSNHLDLKHQAAVLNYFKQLTQQNKCVILSTHDINIAQRYCDFIVLFYEDGTVTAGKTSDLLQQKPLEKLYQCSLRAVSNDKETVWVAGEPA